jgi:hypothetical protein
MAQYGTRYRVKLPASRASPRRRGCARGLILKTRPGIAAYAHSMSGCPVCRGNERSPLAPGFWRCESIVTDYQVGVVPAPGYPPAFQMKVPMAFPHQRVCGHEYHEASRLDEGEMQYCACGTGAIGRCAIDHRQVCGYHSKMRGGRRLCDECAARFDRAAADTQVAVANAELDSQVAELRPRLEQIRTACRALAAVPDPADKLLALMLVAERAHDTVFAGCPKEVTERGTPEVHQMLMAEGEALRGPDVSALLSTNARNPVLWTFNGPALMQHWQQAGRLRDVNCSLRLIAHEKGRFGGLKRRTRDYLQAWQIQAGQSGYSDSYGGGPGTPDVYVLIDGTIGKPRFQSLELPAEAERDAIELSDVLALIHLRHLAPPALPPAVTTCLAEQANVTFPSAAK